MNHAVVRGGLSEQLMRGTAVFAAASVAQRSIGFLLLPLYARVLDPVEYGQIGVITAIAAALGTILGFGLETAMFRARSLYTDNPSERDRFVNAVGLFALIVPIGTAVVLALLVGAPAATAFGVPVVALQVAIMGSALMASATAVPLALLRAEQRLRDYLRLTGIQVVLGVGMTLLFVVVLRWGVLGWMTATALTSATLVTRGLMILGHRWSPAIDTQYLREALAFGLPLIPHALSHWGLALSDRVVLGALADPTQVGSYYVAYQFSLPISVIAVAMSQGLQPLYAEGSTSAVARSQVARATTHQALLVALLAATVAAVGPPASLVLLPAAYGEAAGFIPWIALGVALFGLYLIPMNAISLIAGRTRWVWVFTLLAALTNIALNLLFVPRFGALAAAVNTAAAYAVLIVGVFIYMRRVSQDPIPYDWRRIGLGMALITVAAASAMMLAPSEPIIALVLRSAVMLVVAALLVATGLWPLWRRFSSQRAPQDHADTRT